MFFPDGFRPDSAFESLNIENIEIDLAHNQKFNSIEQPSFSLQNQDAEIYDEDKNSKEVVNLIKDDIENLLSDDQEEEACPAEISKGPAEETKHADLPKENSTRPKNKIEDWKVLLNEPLKSIGNNFSGERRRL